MASGSMKARLAGKFVLVTGRASGIGHASVLTLVMLDLTDGNAMRAATNRFAEEAIPVQRVVNAVLQSLVIKRPVIRCVEGARAWAAVPVLRWLPQSIRDRIVLNKLRMP